MQDKSTKLSFNNRIYDLYNHKDTKTQKTYKNSIPFSIIESTSKSLFTTKTIRKINIFFATKALRH